MIAPFVLSKLLAHLVRPLPDGASPKSTRQPLRDVYSVAEALPLHVQIQIDSGGPKSIFPWAFVRRGADTRKSRTSQRVEGDQE